MSEDNQNDIFVLIWAGVLILIGLALLMTVGFDKAFHYQIFTCFLAYFLYKRNIIAYWIAFLVSIGLIGTLLKAVGYGAIPGLLCGCLIIFLYKLKPENNKHQVVQEEISTENVLVNVKKEGGSNIIIPIRDKSVTNNIEVNENCKHLDVDIEIRNNKINTEKPQQSYQNQKKVYEYKVKLSCPTCGEALMVDGGKLLKIHCPNCNAEFTKYTF